MLWMRASSPDDGKTRNRLDTVEMSGVAAFQASILHILSEGLGFRKSLEQNVCVLGDDRVIPMMSYGLVEYLMGLDLSSFEVLELGRALHRVLGATCQGAGDAGDRFQLGRYSQVQKSCECGDPHNHGRHDRRRHFGAWAHIRYCRGGHQWQQIPVRQGSIAVAAAGRLDPAGQRRLVSQHHPAPEDSRSDSG
jgi:hypothetical protein